MELFALEHQIGIFRGFTNKGGLEFHADVVLPYQASFQRRPMHGQFVLVQLDTPAEAVLGRITSLSADGQLSSSTGEDFSVRNARRGRGGVDSKLMERFLKYRVNLRMLGVVRVEDGKSLQFLPSHRRLPHLGSPVAFPSPEVLQDLASSGKGALLGHLAYGEFVYLDAKTKLPLTGMRRMGHEVQVHFDIKQLISRRSFIFARAGFGKSNLNKLLFSELYRTTPTITKPGREVPVGTVIFDPEGEYFWPDASGRPGLCDVPHLREHLVVFTPRRAPSEFYGSFVAEGIKLDVRRLAPADVIAIGLSAERQEQSNVRKLRSLSSERWQALVNLVHQHRNQSSLETISALLDLDPVRQEVEAIAARSNMAAIVGGLHDPSSQFLDMLLYALREGKLCVVDISQMRGAQSLILTGLILKRIFDKNQREFTNYPATTIPVIAVVEEAQTVLGQAGTSNDPYISWVKEGRKYDLGALLITQQPGSIPMEILSQGDNWFIFHLLADADLSSIGRANAHFSDDLLSSLLNEPLAGQGIFWSSTNLRSYPLSVRVRLFEELYADQRPHYNEPAADTYARGLRQQFEDLVSEQVNPEDVPEAGAHVQRVDDFGELESASIPVPPRDENDEEAPPEKRDTKALYEAKVIAAFRASDHAKQLTEGKAVAWGSIKAFVIDQLPPELDDRGDLAFQLVPRAMNRVFGGQGTYWHTFRDERNVTRIKTGAKEIRD